MSRKKFKSLALKASIHTVSIKANSIPKGIPKRLYDCVENNRYSTDVHDGEKEYRTKINPNHYKDKTSSKMHNGRFQLIQEVREINFLEDFEGVMESIKQDIGIDSYEFTRIDFPLDNFSVGSYERCMKINRFAIMIMAMQHEPKSNYKSTDLFTEENLTIRLDTRQYSIEYYNKNIESNGSSPVQSRLELRSKRLTGTDTNALEEIDRWIKRLRDIPKGSKKLQDKCNEILLSEWELESASGKVRSKIEFIRNKKGRIFSQKQLIDLCILMDTNAKYAKEMEHKAGVETYADSDLEEYIKIIIEELTNFAANYRKSK